MMYVVGKKRHSEFEVLKNDFVRRNQRSDFSMALEERFSKKYDTKTLEHLGQREEDGVTKDVYRVFVTKNSGELQDFIEVAVPATVEDALMEFEEEEVVEILQEKLVTKARNRKRSSMVSPEEAKKKKEQAKEKVQQLVETLKAAGLNPDEIKEQLGL